MNIRTRGRKWNGAAIFGCLIIALLLTPIGFSQPRTIIRGRIERQVSAKKYPAVRVRVTMAPVNARNRIRTAYTGGDGMYYYFNVAVGQYILQVWDSQNKLIGSYSIVAENKQYTDIKPIPIP